MDYSKIKTFRVKNFRNIGDITLDFTESPIITLIGENEAGKTSLIKAFAVTGLHAYSRDQKDFIRDGTNGFGTVTELVDGTVLTRVKNNATNLYAIERPDGDNWETTKIDAGLPVNVQEIMGLIEEPETKEYLQVRTYEDQLLFVVTPASSNYKVMYNALKVEQLTKAMKKGSAEANELEATLNGNQTKIETLIAEIRKLRIYDIEPAINIRDRAEKEINQLDKIERALILARRVQEINKELGSISQIGQAGLVDIDLVEISKLFGISRNVEKIKLINKSLSIYSKADAIESIDISLSEKIRDTVNKKRELQGSVARGSVYKGINDSSYVDITHVTKLHSVIEHIDRLNSIKNELGLLGIENAKAIDNTEVTVIQKMVKVMSTVNKAKGFNRQLSILNTIGASEIPQNEISTLQNIAKVIGMVGTISNIHVEMSKVDSEKLRINNLIKESGAVVAECPKCGESVVVDTRAYA